MRRKIVGIFVCVILVSTLIPLQTVATQIDNISYQSSNDERQGLMFMWLFGHIKDVRIYVDERIGITVYNGTLVNGGGFVWIPKEFIIPTPAFLQKGDAFPISKEIPDLHTRILQLPNDHVLFSMWFFGIVNLWPKNETASFLLNQILI